MGKNEGGSAFPWARKATAEECKAYGCQPGAHAYFDGMSLRDYFAGQALQGFSGLRAVPNYKEEYWTLASAAYQMADAMLEARK